MLKIILHVVLYALASYLLVKIKNHSEKAIKRKKWF